MCSKLYADGELAATPYETDKVLRHRELCMGLKVLYAKKNHDYGDSFHQTYIEEGMAMSSKQRSKRRPPQPHTTRRLLAEWSITKRQQMIC